MIHAPVRSLADMIGGGAMLSSLLGSIVLFPVMVEHLPHWVESM